MLSAFACGSGNDGNQGADSEMVELFRAIGRANCHQWFTCCPPNELRSAVLLGATEAECIEKQSELAPAIPLVYRSSLDAGRLVFHMDQARACLAAIESATCATPDAQIDCDFYPMIEPRVALGQLCAWEYECISGLCDRDFENDADFGKCIAKAANGAPCSAGRDCSSGLCEYETGGSRCNELRPNGERCNFDSECASGECACAVVEPDQVDCLAVGATGVCGPQPENGCSLD